MAHKRNVNKSVKNRERSVQLINGVNLLNGVLYMTLKMLKLKVMEKHKILPVQLNIKRMS